MRSAGVELAVSTATMTLYQAEVSLNFAEVFINPGCDPLFSYLNMLSLGKLIISNTPPLTDASSSVEVSFKRDLFTQVLYVQVPPLLPDGVKLKNASSLRLKRKELLISNG